MVGFADVLQTGTGGVVAKLCGQEKRGSAENLEIRVKEIGIMIIRICHSCSSISS